MMYEAFTKPGAAGTIGGGGWIDVRDLALAHSRALQREAASGERIIISAGPFVWQDWRAFFLLRYFIPLCLSLHAVDAIPADKAAKYQRGTPASSKDHVHKLNYDASKSKSVLGIQYRTIEQTTKDVIADWEEKGW